MKMTSLFRTLRNASSVALIGALIVGLASCATSEDENNMIKVKGGTATIDYTNDYDATWTAKDGKWYADDVTYCRGFHSLKTKHIDAVNTINFSKDSEYAGVMGYVFGLTIRKVDGKKLYDFGLAGVRYYNGKAQWYVSYYYNVYGDDVSNGKYGNFTGVNGKTATAVTSSLTVDDNGNIATTNGSTAASSDVCYEWEVVKGTDGTFEALDIAIADGYMTVVVEVEYKDSKYTVKAFKDKDLKTQVGSTAEIDGAKTTASKKWKGDDVEDDDDYQAKIGFYANVYPKSVADGVAISGTAEGTEAHTLTGDWSFTDINGNAIPVEFDEEF